MASTNLDLIRSIYADCSSADWAHPEIEFVIGSDPLRASAAAGRNAPAARIVVGDSFRTPAPSDSIEIASEMPATLTPSRTQRLDI